MTNREIFKAGPVAQVETRRDGERWTLVFVRELRHAPEVVWQALTDPAQLRAWAPFDADRDLGRTGAATLTMAGDPDETRMPAEVVRAEPPRLLEYTWGEDLLRWELAATATGTRLTLQHSLADRGWMSRVAAGWHICIDVAERLLAGAPVGRIVGEEAKQHGWERLEAVYADRLGVASEGWPADVA